MISEIRGSESAARLFWMARIAAGECSREEGYQRPDYHMYTGEFDDGILYYSHQSFVCSLTINDKVLTARWYPPDYFVWMTEPMTKEDETIFWITL